MNMSLRQRLMNRETLYGTWCLLPSPEVINVIAKAGMDFVIIDQEHGAIDATLSQKMVMAAQAENCSAVVRVGENDELRVLQALDLGADGIIVPHVDSVAEAQKAVSYAKYPPIGIRGYSPYARSGGYTNQKGYTDLANETGLVGVIIEGEHGIMSIDSIASVEGLDLLYVGTYDISSVLGIPGDVTNPRVIDMVKKCAQAIQNANKISGCMFNSLDELELYDKIGLNFRVFSVDSAILYDSYHALLESKGGHRE